MEKNKTACIALNGRIEEDLDFYLRELKGCELLLAANGGARLFKLLDLRMDLLIGDQDSLTEAEVDYWQERGAEIIEYPAAKDETDLELCLKHCAEMGAAGVKILAALGGRIDQLLANIYQLEYARETGMEAVILSPEMEIGLIQGDKLFQERQGCRLSLLALDREVSGLQITGCKYNVEHFLLKRRKTRGISNIIKDERAKISADRGSLLYVLFTGESNNHQ